MQALIVFLLAFSAPAFALDYGLGVGLDVRVNKDVNPAFTSVRALPQFFQELRFHPFTIALELAQDNADSAVGGFAIERQTTVAQAWARYAFLDFDQWAPYLSVGVGGYFDRITSSLYNGETDVRRGTRWMWGLGGGVTKTYWEHLLLGAEARASFIKEQKDPSFSLVLRVGYLL